MLREMWEKNGHMPSNSTLLFIRSNFRIAEARRLLKVITQKKNACQTLMVRWCETATVRCQGLTWCLGDNWSCGGSTIFFCPRLEVSKRSMGSFSALKELVRFIINWLTYPPITIFLLTLVEVCVSNMV